MAIKKNKCIRTVTYLSPPVASYSRLASTNARARAGSTCKKLSEDIKTGQSFEMHACALRTRVHARARVRVKMCISSTTYILHRPAGLPHTKNLELINLLIITPVPGSMHVNS